MKLLLITIYIIIISPLCDCAYEGSYSKVIWNESEKKYISTNINLGESLLSAEFDYCYKNKNQLNLKGKVHNRNTLIGNDETINIEIVIDRCDKDGNVLEQVMMTKKDGFFDFKLQRNRREFLVFREKGAKEGARYDIKSFR